MALPFIWGISIPLVVLDLFMEIYHHVAFPLYGIPIVRRSNYIRIDRQKLEYLSTIDKLSCMYCGYANGLAAYMVKIAGDTEKYWCGIKHHESNGYIPNLIRKIFCPTAMSRPLKILLKKNKKNTRRSVDFRADRFFQYALRPRMVAITIIAGPERISPRPRS